MSIIFNSFATVDEFLAIPADRQADWSGLVAGVVSDVFARAFHGGAWHLPASEVGALFAEGGRFLMEGTDLSGAVGFGCFDEFFLDAPVISMVDGAMVISLAFRFLSLGGIRGQFSWGDLSLSLWGRYVFTGANGEVLKGTFGRS